MRKLGQLEQFSQGYTDSLLGRTVQLKVQVAGSPRPQQKKSRGKWLEPLVQLFYYVTKLPSLSSPPSLLLALTLRLIQSHIPHAF